MKLHKYQIADRVRHFVLKAIKGRHMTANQLTEEINKAGIVPHKRFPAETRDLLYRLQREGLVEFRTFSRDRRTGKPVRHYNRRRESIDETA